jgi:MAM domain.
MFNATAQTCASPENIQQTRMHYPSWYGATFSWDHSPVPASGNPAPADPGATRAQGEAFYNSGTIITHYGAGHEGGDVSARLNGTSGYAYNAAHNRDFSVADDFILHSETEIEKAHFYVYQTGVGFEPTITDAYLRIYNGNPSSGGQVVWGDWETNRMASATATNIYRVDTSWIDDPQRPIMLVTVDVQTTLPAGVYWLEASFIGSASNNTYVVPVSIRGQIDEGNALLCNAGTWSEAMNTGRGGVDGIAFILYGTPSAPYLAGYNVYRDDVKLNEETWLIPHYGDVMPTFGEYEYKVEAVWSDGCTSESVSLDIAMEINPCEVDLVAPIEESFDEEDFGAGCWITESPHYIFWDRVTEDDWVQTSPHSGIGMIRYNSTGHSSGKGSMATPTLNMNNEIHTLTFYLYRGDESPGKKDLINVYLSETTDYSDKFPLLTIHRHKDLEPMVETAGWYEYSVTLYSEEMTTAYVIIEGVNDNFGNEIYLDDLKIISGADPDDICNAPRNVQAELGNDDWYNVDLSWNIPAEGTASTLQGYNVYRDNVKLNETLVTTQSYRDLLERGAEYTYAIESVWASGCTVREYLRITMSTKPCDEFIELPINESFDFIELPWCWETTSEDDATPWKFIEDSMAMFPDANTHSGKGMAYYDGFYYMTGTSGLLVTPAFKNATNLSFWVYRDTDSSYANDFINVYLSETKEIGTASPLITIYRHYESEPVAAAGWNEYTITLDMNSMDMGHIIFEGVSDWGGRIYIDDVVVEGGSSTFIINATAGENCMISPSGEIKIEAGADRTFAVIPKLGYVVDQILVDGVNDPAAVERGSYQFINVQENHTIHATAKPGVGIEEVVSSLSYFPNPTSGTLFISNPDTAIKSIKVMDITGKIIYETNNNNSEKATLDLTGFADGIYFINVDGQTIKIIKQ